MKHLEAEFEILVSVEGVASGEYLTGIGIDDFKVMVGKHNITHMLSERDLRKLEEMLLQDHEDEIADFKFEKV